MKKHVKGHLVAVGVEEGFEVDDVWMGYESHDLQFTILKEDEYSRGR